MASSLSVEQLYRQSLYEITDYVRYCYASNGRDLPGALINALQDLDDLRSRPYNHDVFRPLLQVGAELLADPNLPNGDARERDYIIAHLNDLGFFLEDGIVHADFVV